MPANANRRGDLHAHLVRSWHATGARPPDQQRAQRLHPDWLPCAAGCGWPVDPVAGTVHTGCETV